MTRSRTRAGPTFGLRVYLAALIVLFAATALISTLYVRSQAELGARREETDDAQFMANLAASEVAASLASLEATVARTAASPGIVPAFNPASPCNLVFGAVGVFQQAHLDLLAPDGSVICSSAAWKSTDAGYGGSAWFSRALAGQTFAGPIADSQSGGFSAVSAAPVPGRGVVAGFVDLAGLGAVMASRFAGPNQLEFLITTVDGKTAVSRSLNSTRWVGASLEGTAFGASAGQAEALDVDGVRRLYAQAPVAGHDWKLYAGVDVGLALASVSDLTAQNLWINVVRLLVLLIGTLVVYRLITKPIRDLSRSVRAGITADAQSPIRISGPAEIVALGEDFNRLIAKVQAELSERQHAELRVRGMIDASLDAVVGMDQRGEVIEWSHQAEAMFGWSREEAIDAPLANLIIPERYRAKHLAGLERYQRTGEGPVLGKRLELEAVARDGNEFPIELTITPVKTPTGGVFSAFIRDITARRTAEEQRIALEQRLRQSERLESIGRLVGGIAHDFNNLLAIVLNYCEFIAERLGPDDANQQDLAQIRGAAERATTFTRQLLTFARREAVDPEDVDLNQLIQGFHDLVGRTLPENIVTQMRLAADLWSVHADRSQLEQLVLNLVVNAGDAMAGRGGTLLIFTANEDYDVDSAAQHGDLAPGRYVQLTVTDSGKGMSKDVLGRAFDPFFTTKRAGKGTGLGLATVYGVVQQAGGRISIYSEVGNGTTVRVLLPAHDAVVVPAVPINGRPADERNQPTETILLVEDEEGVRNAAHRILKSRGYKVLQADKPADALALMNGRTESVDLLLTDMVMPGMSGRELARQLRAARPTLPVIYMTGYSEELLRRDADDLGEAVIEKPFTRRPLLAAVAKALSERALVGSSSG
ncbi:MAG: response regulator [Chloroflexota bacterium]|nr:response regulator [Chloroflexota bacterium]